MQRTASDVIEEKGVGEIARALDVDPAAVRMWKHRRQLPRRHWPELVQKFPDLTLDELRAIEAHSRAA